MREILFKAKRKDTGEWVEGNAFFADNGQCEICIGTPIVRITYEVDPETVCEYSGLNIEGKRVFENDKLSFSYYGKTYTGYVTFIDGAFCVQCDVCAPYLDDVIFKHDAKIIGNIYDEED